MYEIEFYEDKYGVSEVAEYIKELRRKSTKNKEARINLNKIVAYIDLLEEITGKGRNNHVYMEESKRGIEFD